MNNDEKRKTMICIRNKKIDSLQKEMDELKAAVGNIEALNKTTEERKRERCIEDIKRRIKGLKIEVTKLKKKLRFFKMRKPSSGNRNKDANRKNMIKTKNAEIDILQKETDKLLKPAVGNIS